MHNETATQNHWILLKLVGHKSNRDAIGASVTFTTSSGSQYATVSTASSYLSASDKRVHFGAGQEKTVQKIEIRWPSGIMQTLKDIPADQILQIDEPVAPANSKP
jgi:enediyne biosynthesis protein E4